MHNYIFGSTRFLMYVEGQTPKGTESALLPLMV